MSHRWMRITVLVALGLAGAAIAESARHGHRAVAVALVVLVVVLGVAGTQLRRRATRTDGAVGRVRVSPRSRATGDDGGRPVFAPGDRVVWCGTIGSFDAPGQLVYSGTFVADGPAPWVTIRHDDAPDDARVRPERLFRESDYRDLVESHGAPPPTTWG